MLRKVSELVPCSVLRTMYLSLIYPFIVYGIEAWGASCKTGLTKLRALQDRCVRLLVPTVGHAVPSAYSVLRLLPLEQVHKIFLLVKFYKYFLLGKSLTYFNKIVLNIPSHDHLTRFLTNDKINILDINVSRYYSSFLYQGIRLWNELSGEIRNSTSIHIFKIKLRKIAMLGSGPSIPEL